jgi:hypothetical protein
MLQKPSRLVGALVAWHFDVETGREVPPRIRAEVRRALEGLGSDGGALGG